MTAATDTSTAQRFWESLGRIPVDSVLLLAYLPVAELVLMANGGGLLSLVVGMPLLFVLPGYALLTVLFPRHAGEVATALGDRVAARRGALTLGERIALSFGVSVTLLPILGLGLAASGLGLSLGPLLAGLGLLVGGGAIVGAVRRARLPDAERYTLPFGEWFDAFTGESIGTLAVNAVLAIAVLVAISSIAGALFTAGSAQSDTHLSLLERTPTGGYEVADPPASVAQGDSIPLVVGITNSEGREHTYTLVAELQRLSERERETVIVERSRVYDAVVTVPANRTIHRAHTVQPDLAGSGLRLTYYLYIGPAPAEPTSETAYRTVHVWVDVTP